ncbi:hypothetical protein Tco_0276086 [Tanacetum coccineum]
MTNGREESPPPGFATLTPIPGPSVGELPPITVSTFTVRTPENTPLTNYASTSANPNPLISPAFIEANDEALKSLLKERRKQIRNEGLCTELDYYSEEYDEDKEMEPRHAHVRETNPALRTGTRVPEDKEEGLLNSKMLQTRMGAGLKGNPRVEGLRNEEQKITRTVW